MQGSSSYIMKKLSLINENDSFDDIDGLSFKRGVEINGANRGKTAKERHKLTRLVSSLSLLRNDAPSNTVEVEFY